MKNHFIFIFVSLLFFSCSSNNTSDQTVVSFDGGNVTEQEVIEHYLKKTKFKPDEIPTENILSNIASNLAIEKIIIHEARKNNIENDSLFTKLFSKLKIKLKSKRFNQEVIIERIITDSLVSKYYSEYSPQYSVKYIMRPFLRDSKESFIKSQEQKINSAYDDLINGKSFAEVVQEYSQDIVSKKKEGSIGWIIRESLGDSALRSVLDTIKDNVFSKPFRGYGGYYILLKDDTRTVEVPEFNKVKTHIIQSLQHSRKHLIEDLSEKYFEEYAKSHKYSIIDDNVNKIFDNLKLNDKNNYFKKDGFKIAQKYKNLVIAEYNGGSITAEYIFADKKKSPINKSEFFYKLKSIAKQHLFSLEYKNVFKGLNDKNEIFDTELVRIKEALIRNVFYKKEVKDKADYYINPNNDLKKSKNSSLKRKYEIELKDKFEDRLRKEYNFNILKNSISVALENTKKAKIKNNKSNNM